MCTIGGQQTMLSMSMEPSRVQALKHGVRVLREYGLPSGRKGMGLEEQQVGIGKHFGPKCPLLLSLLVGVRKINP